MISRPLVLSSFFIVFVIILYLTVVTDKYILHPDMGHVGPPRISTSQTCEVNSSRIRASRKQDFQEVIEAHCYVYSAFLDFRFKSRGYIRVIGLMLQIGKNGYHHGQIEIESDKNPRYWCLVWYANIAEPESVRGKVVDARDTNKRFNRYVVAMFTCLNPRDTKPLAVSIVTDQCQQPKNYLIINLAKIPKVNITACVPALHNRYSNIHQLTEMIEVSRMFGVDRFVFYNFSISGHMNKYLHHYIEKGIVILLSWNISSLTRYINDWNPSYFGQQAAQTDCFYRNMDVSNYISFTDIDEIMAVRTTGSLSLTDILQNVTSTANGTICDYQFLNAFFRKDKNISNYDPQISKWKPPSLLHTYRGDFWPVHMRSKYIADTRYLIMPTVHLPRLCHQGSIEVIIPSHLAALHHYRWYGDPRGYYPDRTMWRYKDDILTRLEEIHTTIGI